MIKRESYMKKIRPFINSDLVKVLTGIRRCGKSVMLDLIKQELLQQGVTPPFPLVKDIVGYLKMCHSILPIKR